MRDVLPFREKTSSLHDARHTLLVTFAETVLDRHLSRYASIHEIHHCSSISKTTVPEPYPSFRWVVWVGLSITSSSAIDCHTAPVSLMACENSTSSLGSSRFPTWRRCCTYTGTQFIGKKRKTAGSSS